jgi:hypothetical protein
LSKSLTLRFSPRTEGLTTGSKYHFRVQLKCDGYVSDYDIEKLTVGTWIERIPGGMVTIWGTGLIAAYGFLLLALYWLFPRSLLAIRHWAFHPVLDSVPKPISAGLQLTAELSVLWLWRQPRVLDSWVEAHYEGWSRRLQETERQLFERHYLPLPVAIGQPEEGETIREPGPDRLGRFFTAQARAVQIVAVGGAGKTILAMQLCRWFLGEQAGRPLGSFRRLPIWLDGEVADLEAKLDGKFRILLDGEMLDRVWRDTLINKGRVCIVADRLSEQSEFTHQRILALHETWPGALLIITARHQFEFRQSYTLIQPLPLDRFEIIASYIERELEHWHVCTAGSATVSIEQRAQIAKGLADMIARSTGSGSAQLLVTPLLVGLFVRAAKELINTGAKLERLPTSVPETYFAYVEGLFKSRDDLISAAYDLGRLALEDRAAPGQLSRRAVKERSPEGTPLNLNETYRRMVDGGLLQAEPAGDDLLLRFSLDPVAEYLAAFRYAQACGSDLQKWQTLIDSATAKGAEGLIVALENVYRAYVDRMWPEMPGLFDQRLAQAR